MHMCAVQDAQGFLQEAADLNPGDAMIGSALQRCREGLMVPA